MDLGLLLVALVLSGYLIVAKYIYLVARILARPL